MNSDRDLLEELITEGKQFSWSNFCIRDEVSSNRFGGHDTPNWLAWKTRVVNAIQRISSDSSPARELATKGAAFRTSGYGPEIFNSAKLNLIEALELTRTALDSDKYGELKALTSTHPSPTLSNRIFIVHGHDSELKSDVERFLREIGLEPVTLDRQVDEGATIIEKFEKHSDVGFAIILLTPDEIAYTVDQDELPDIDRKKEKRARPNVIFEFGYFVGRLGRNKVCCLHRGEVTVPSDLNGLLYKNVDESVDSQAYNIIRELKAAGYNVTL